ncbi:MAG: hypothetical protein Q7S51_10200 [Gallionellaceae bacterium]|nr:hypothetical protein [Gallionellaceae bacterium]
MNTPLQVCGKCARWSRHEDVCMAHYGGCTYRLAGHYSARQSPCLFNPSRWSKK